MRKVIVAGAFDRYNYGDNLMPMLFEMFIKKYHPDVLSRVSLEFAALTNSDLSRYKVKKTKSLGDAISNGSVQAVVSIGGEVLCASSSSLFMHMDHSRQALALIRAIRRLGLTSLADMICRSYYRLPWEYPYIPGPKRRPLPRVAFNTIGGEVPDPVILPGALDIRRRLSRAAYVSVRDSRTADSISSFCKTYMYPDSAVIMSDLVNDEFLTGHLTARTIETLSARRYVIFQAAPRKVGAPSEDVVELLRVIQRETSLRVLLCPIGYAKGHDDRQYLSTLSELSGGEFAVLDDLNVWEIMYAIKYSKAFMGTSLHGAITAMSFGVPHIGINQEVRKLDQFLKDWSINPFNRCYSISEISQVFKEALNAPRAPMLENAMRLKGLAKENYTNLLSSLALI